MKIKGLTLSLVGILVLALLAGCGNGEPTTTNGDDPPPVETFTYNDGVFEAVSDDSRGFAWVKLFVVRDEIVDIEIVEHDNMGEAKDYDVYGGDRFTELQAAHEALAARIVAQNTWDVDVFTGATSTSTKVMEAAQRALDKALVERTGTTTYFDGTFLGASTVGSRGFGVALVTIANDVITDVELLETTTWRDDDGNLMMDAKNRGLWIFKDEDYSHAEFHEAQEAIAQAMIDSQSFQVDVFTGATSSSNKWMEAVERALEAAKR